MSVEIRTQDRVFVIISMILIPLCLGVLYSWAVFRPVLTSSPYGLSIASVSWVYAVEMLTFIMSVIFLARKVETLGPGKTIRTGGILLGVGYILPAVIGPSFGVLLLSIGILVGVGTGMIFLTPIAVGIRWFPRFKGLVSALPILFFSAGSLFWVKLAGTWLGGLLGNLNIFGLDGLRSTFFLYGCIFLVVILFCGCFLKFPPGEWFAENYPELDSREANLSTRQMLSDSRFYLLFLAFFFSSIAGMMVISSMKFFSYDAFLFVKAGTLKAAGVPEEYVKQAAATAGSVLFLYTAMKLLSSLIVGAFADFFGAAKSLTGLVILQAFGFFTYYHFTFIFGGNSFYGVVVLGLTYGGMFLFFSVITAEYFGIKTVAGNLGVTYAAFGVGTVIAPSIAVVFKDSMARATDPSGWLPLFNTAGVMSLLAVIFIFLAMWRDSARKKN